MAYNLTELDEKTRKSFEPAEKIGLVASVNPEGLPHITLITSIAAAGPQQIILGEFCKGRSKAHIQKNPKIAFLVMRMDRKMWRGHAQWSHLRQEGPEYEKYNDLPMFRYNAYFGINTVHYLDLVDARGPEGLPLARIMLSSLLTKMIRFPAGDTTTDRILSILGERLFNRLDALKFIAYIRKDGYPEIVPLLQCRAAGSRRLVFSTLAYEKELEKISPEQTVAVFCMNLKMEDVMIRGIFRKSSRWLGLSTGNIDIEWVYNSMPPGHGQIYPPLELAPVMEFADC